MKTWSIFLILICHKISLSTQQGPTSPPLYCHASPNNITGNGPFPTLPDQYQTIIEANIIDKGFTVIAEEYFDGPGDRATLIMTQNGTKHTLVFDYANDQLFYVSNGQCRVSDLATDDNNILFGDHFVQGVPHVFTTGGVLHFAAKFGEAYQGNNETVRGIKADKWTSCLFWPQLNSNFTLDYYFTSVNWSDAILYPQIPLRAVATGIQQQDNGSWKKFQHYYDYVNFRTEILVDESIFETPKGVVCAGRKKTMPVPKLPDFYHYRQEIVTDAKDNIYQADVWYDSEYRLIRYDYRTPQKIDPLYTTNPISEVHDYNYGIRYVRDIVTGQCIATSLSNSSFDAKQNATALANNGSFVLGMKNPMQLFYLDSSYTYTGSRLARGLPCDVFTSIRTDYQVMSFGAVPTIFEYYFLQDGSKELPDDGSTTPTNVPVFLEITAPTVGYHIMYNFLDFDKEHPDISVFDVSNCYTQDAKLQFKVTFPGKLSNVDMNLLKTQAQRVFADTMQVSYLRVQDVNLEYDNSLLYISATLLDRSPAAAQFTYIPNQVIPGEDDKVIPSPDVASIEDCASRCVTNPDFTCNSFDFCPKDNLGICRLSRKHIDDGTKLAANDTCDHFSRTVTGPVKQELSISDGYANLQNAVYSQAISLLPIYSTSAIPSNPIVAVDVAVTFGWLTQKPVPSLTGQFSYHLEVTVPSVPAVYDSHIWYDSAYKLVRYDLVNTQPLPPIYSVDPVTAIHDYNTGLAYNIDNAMGNCTIAPLNNSTFDAVAVNASLNNGSYIIKMRSPLDIFYLTGTYRYAGQRTVRGMLCDVYEDHRTDFRLNGQTKSPDTLFQFYFLSDSWNQLPEGSGTPVSAQPIRLIVSSSAGGYSLTYNFYDFSENHPDLSNFDIRPCFVGDQVRHFSIRFQGAYHPVLDHNLKFFQREIQLLLAKAVNCTPLRFQDPQITYANQNTFYIGTFVEQAPYALGFTKTPGRKSLFTADKNYYLIPSASQCAAYCRKETTFACESFDFCPSQQICQLSRQHAIDGSKMQANVTCDHYSRTVDSTAGVEPTVSEGFLKLKDLVYKGLFKVAIPLQTSNANMIYTAKTINTHILRPDSQISSASQLLHFNTYEHSVVLMNNDMRIAGVSVDQCAARCLSELTFDCQSFDYCSDVGVCRLSKVHPDSQQDLVKPNNLCDLYSRKYTDNYQETAGVVVQTPADTTVTMIASADLCAQRCTQYTDFACKSFDYCPTLQQCSLRKKHILDIPTNLISKSPVCNHYSRSYVNDFQKGKHLTLTVANYLTIGNVSVDACAKLCVENNGFECKTFAFCNTTCQLFSTHSQSSQGDVHYSATCNLYTRQYFPDRTPYNPNPAKYYHNVTTTINTQGSTGYSGGAMAGLAIGMFVPGVVLGAALLYFMRTKRLVKEEQMRMGFVNMNHDDDEPHHFPTPDPDPSPAHKHAYDSPHDDETQS